MASGGHRSETTLILGGARSGKSRLAESIIEPQDGHAIYIATAQAFDDEMTANRNLGAEIEVLAAEIPSPQASLVLVSNETGMGIVPENHLARRFRDFSGIMNQQIAAASDNVLLVAAGLPLVLKGRNPAELSA